MRYGQALRATGQRSQAVAVLEQATIAHPGNKALLAGYGRALADNGNFKQAFEVLGRAHSPDNPDWRILSVQGTALDQLGRHDEARRYYASALKIVPEEPSVLSNLGMSYVLSKDMPKAEENLRRAYGSAGADTRVRQNLGLVVGLQGRFAEAETIVKADLPPDEAAANVAYLKQMLSRKDGPRGGTGPSRWRRSIGRIDPTPHRLRFAIRVRTHLLMASSNPVVLKTADAMPPAFHNTAFAPSWWARRGDSPLPTLRLLQAAVHENVNVYLSPSFRPALSCPRPVQ